MKSYPSQIPSQRQRTGAGNLRTLPANPPRRVAQSAAPRQTSARIDSAAPRNVANTDSTRQNSVTHWESVTPADSAPRSAVAGTDSTPRNVTSTDAAPRSTVAGADSTRQTSARTDSTRQTSSRRADSTRRRRTRPRSYRHHLLHKILTASAAMYLALFLIPFLFTADNGSAPAPLSTALKRSPDAANDTLSAGADTLAQITDTDSLAQAAENDSLAQAAENDSLAQAAENDSGAQVPPPENEPFTGQLDEDCFLRVLNRKDDEVSVMSMQEYLVCVLRGEMPGYFELDALKAQAVAARTYTRYMLHSGSKHGDRADICTSPSCCQAYLSAASARQKWGYLPEDEEQKLRAAVIETDGETMLYDGEPILAVFHASSAGLTRTSGDVWFGDKPYLQPVTSPENADNTPNYYSHVEFTLAGLQEKLRSAFPKANLSGDASEWLTDAERDAAGNIINVYVGGIKTQGSRVRSALGLRSACFTWEYDNGKATFYVTGYGHGVGLSQYGANQMARDGADYRAILTHYYTGVRIGGYVPS